LKRYKQTRRYKHFSQPQATLFCGGLILIFLSSCSTPSYPPNATATKNPGATMIIVPVETSTATSRITALPGTPPVTSPSGWDTVTSENWAGYTLPQSGVTGVRAAWTEPDISNVPNAHIATWVGIGGWANSYNNIVQIGTLAHVTSDGTIVHTVWYETLPPNSWIFIGTVSAGDKVFASIELESGKAQNWDLALADETTNQTFKVTVSFLSQRIYSDFVIEDPDATSNNGPPFFPFPRFPTVTFRNANVRYAHDWVAIAAVRAIQVTLVQSGAVVARPGPLANDTFTVTRVGA
jgi:hypothetical protein